MEMVTLPLDEIKPYPNNPRINDKAIDVVAKSIKRYGYRSPIVVDKSNVIISGHTRYEALKLLGHTEAQVIVSTMSKAKAKEFRLIDNKSSELAEWDKDKLIAEVRNIEQGMDDFFGKAELQKMIGDVTQIGKRTASQAEIDRAQERMENHFKEKTEALADKNVNCQCGHCGEFFSFDVIKGKK